MYVYREKGIEKEKGQGKCKEMSIEFSASSSCGNMTLDNTIICRLT